MVQTASYEILIFLQALATEHEMDASRGQGVAIWKHSNVESQEALAESYLRCGAIQQYCELMTRLHQWDHALALAPAVSVDYWYKLMARYELATPLFFVSLPLCVF